MRAAGGAMGLGLRERLGLLRKRLGAFTVGPVDVVVTHCEVNDRHGTGVLLRRLFGAGREVVTVRSRDLYGGRQRFGRRSVRLAHRAAPPADDLARVRAALGGLSVRRILCAPYFPDDVRTALALAETSRAPLATWLLDDQNIHAPSIPDQILRDLLDASRLRLAVSTELRAAYQAKFGHRIALAPPVAPAEGLVTEPVAPDAARLAARRGVVFGNIWGAGWMEGLLAALAGTDLRLAWLSGAGTPWRQDDAGRLAKAGIDVRPILPEPTLIAELRASPFVVVPTGTLDEGDPHGWLARLSLPSRIPFVAATAGAPILVLGHAETAAARFVLRHGLGAVAPYRPGDLRAAVDGLCQPAAQARHRQAAARLAPVLSSAGMLDWLWRSLDAGGAVDGRFDALLEAPPGPGA